MVHWSLVVVGFFVGSFIGVITISLCHAAKLLDDDIEELDKGE